MGTILNFEGGSLHLFFAFVKENDGGPRSEHETADSPQISDHVHRPSDQDRVADPVMDHGEAQTGSAIRH